MTYKLFVADFLLFSQLANNRSPIITELNIVFGIAFN